MPNKQAESTISGEAGTGLPAIRARQVALLLIVGLAAIGGMYLLAGSLEGFSGMLKRLRNGDPAWLVLAASLEALSIGGYATLFWSVVSRDVPHIGWRASVQIPLAGIAALRLLATAGAGGFAVTAWALSRAGMSPRDIGTRMVAAFVVQYSVYVLAIILCGAGLWTGLLPGGGSFALTILPAGLAAAVAAVLLLVSLLPPAPAGAGGTGTSADQRPASRRRRLAGWRLSAQLALRHGVADALRTLAARRGEQRLAGLAGAIAYWGFDAAVLWCSFRAFGEAPALAPVVMTYFVGTAAGLLPLPGGVGGIEGGMIGIAIAFGIDPAHAILAVVGYRVISFWLPTLPGIAGYLGLRRTVHGWEAARAVADPADGEQ